MILNFKLTNILSTLCHGIANRAREKVCSTGRCQLQYLPHLMHKSSNHIDWISDEGVKFEYFVKLSANNVRTHKTRTGFSLTCF